MSDLSERILARLAELGSTPETIAESLRELGFTGRCNGGSCPLANWLRAEFPEVGWVTRTQVLTGPPSRLVAPLTLADLPPEHTEFVEHFDIGGFPDLIEVGS